MEQRMNERTDHLDLVEAPQTTYKGEGHLHFRRRHELNLEFLDLPGFVIVVEISMKLESVFDSRSLKSLRNPIPSQTLEAIS